MPILRVILILLVVGIVGSGIYLFSKPNSPTSQAILSKLPTGSEKTMQDLQSKVNEVKESRIAPLGKTVEESRILTVDENYQKPIHEKAFEYARYQYCLQVVKDFERKDPKQTTTESENGSEKQEE